MKVQEWENIFPGRKGEAYGVGRLDECVVCKRKTEEVSLTPQGDPVCGRCVKIDAAQYCNECGELFLDKDTHLLGDGETILCHRCFAAVTEKCSECELTFRRDHLHRAACGNLLCDSEDCRYFHFSTCGVCVEGGEL